MRQWERKRKASALVQRPLPVLLAPLSLHRRHHDRRHRCGFSPCTTTTTAMHHHHHAPPPRFTTPGLHLAVMHWPCAAGAR